MAIVLVEQYFELARDLADEFAVMDRGAVMLSGARGDLGLGIAPRLIVDSRFAASDDILRLRQARIAVQAP